MIYIFTLQKATALGLDEKSTWAKTLEIPSRKEPAKSSSKAQPSFGFENMAEIKDEDQVYLDISSFSQGELKSALQALEKSRAGSFWGIIDPRGAAEDPALFFFQGAFDYIGPALVKKGLDKKRFATAQKRLRAEEQSVEKKKTVALGKAKLPTGAFGGWKSMRTGTTAPFLFLFLSVSGNKELRSKVGDPVFKTAKDRLRDIFQQALSEANGLLWIETENNCLFLIPPRLPNARAAVEAGLKLILNSGLINIEKLMFPFQVGFTLALHYGETVFRAPGKTGEIVSETVNYIFHLGAKKAEAGRLTISGNVPEQAIPEELLDLFSPAGVFEGIPIRHSKRFV